VLFALCLPDVPKPSLRAKRSNPSRIKKEWIASSASLLAMTAVVCRHTFAISRRVPELCMESFAPKKIRGRGECRMRAAPAVSCAKLCEETHTSIQVQRRQSGIPCAMVLRLIARSPRRRIPFATVIGGLVVLPDPVGPTKPPPTQHQQRVPGPHDFAVRFSAVRLARLDRSQASSTRPATIRRA
jgi:hypothetical protein